jgi:hypothetical protein
MTTVIVGDPERVTRTVGLLGLGELQTVSPPI